MLISNFLILNESLILFILIEIIESKLFIIIFFQLILHLILILLLDLINYLKNLKIFNFK